MISPIFLVLLAFASFLSILSITIKRVLHLLQLGKGLVARVVYWNPYLIVSISSKMGALETP